MLIKIKKIIIGLFFLSFFNGCVQNTALIGPVYTLSSSGNVYHTGLSYGSSQVITKSTGKSVIKNINEILQPNKKDSELRKLLKKRIIETRKKLQPIEIEPNN